MSVAECYATITSPFGATGEMWGNGHGGTDYARAAGEPVYVYAVGTIRYTGNSGWGGGLVGMDLDAGDHAGWAHLDPIWVAPGQRVKPGDILGLVAGHGQNHGTQWTGPHIHTTRSTRSAVAAATGARPLIDPAPGIAVAIGQGEEEMSQKAEQQIEAVYAALFGPANLGVPKTTWARPFGEKPGEAYYGLFDVAIRTQELVVTQQGQIAALTNLVEQITQTGSGGVIDMKAVTEAAERGAREALDGLTLKATT